MDVGNSLIGPESLQENASQVGIRSEWKNECYLIPGRSMYGMAEHSKGYIFNGTMLFL